LLRSLNAVQIRHGKIHDRHVRLELRRQLERFATAAGLGDDAHVRLAVDQQSHAFAQHRVIVGDEHSYPGGIDRHRRGLPARIRSRLPERCICLA
jgi:hypothetical protein